MILPLSDLMSVDFAVPARALPAAAQGEPSAGSPGSAAGAAVRAAEARFGSTAAVVAIRAWSPLFIQQRTSGVAASFALA